MMIHMEEIDLNVHVIVNVFKIAEAVKRLVVRYLFQGRINLELYGQYLNIIIAF